jgi:hypothetical protein
MELAYRYSGINNLQRFYREGWQTLIIHPGYEGPGAASWLLLQGYRVGWISGGNSLGKLVWFPDLGIWVEDAQQRLENIHCLSCLGTVVSQYQCAEPSIFS